MVHAIVGIELTRTISNQIKLNQSCLRGVYAVSVSAWCLCEMTTRGGHMGDTWGTRCICHFCRNTHLYIQPCVYMRVTLALSRHARRAVLAAPPALQAENFLIPYPENNFCDASSTRKKNTGGDGNIGSCDDECAPGYWEYRGACKPCPGLDQCNGRHQRAYSGAVCATCVCGAECWSRSMQTCLDYGMSKFGGKGRFALECARLWCIIGRLRLYFQ